MDKGEIVTAAFIDFRKAFDYVDPDNLISRIESFFNTVIFELFRIDLKPLAVNLQNGLLSSMNIMPFKYRLLTRFALFTHRIMNVFLPNI
jgi:hypothetical protein